jgi:hypothetical protein
MQALLFGERSALPRLEGPMMAEQRESMLARMTCDINQSEPH